MKHLSIIRHAKAERPEAYPSDFARPLTTRGHREALRIGALLHQLEPAVDLILSSPAARAAQTTDHLVTELAYTQAVTWTPSIYLAAPDTLLDLLRKCPDEAAHVAVVGHNPGLEELSAGLCTGAPENSVLTLATATLAHFDLDIVRWSQLRWGAGQLKLLVAGKWLKKE